MDCLANFRVSFDHVANNAELFQESTLLITVNRTEMGNSTTNGKTLAKLYE